MAVGGCESAGVTEVLVSDREAISITSVVYETLAGVFVTNIRTGATRLIRREETDSDYLSYPVVEGHRILCVHIIKKDAAKFTSDTDFILLSLDGKLLRHRFLAGKWSPTTSEQGRFILQRIDSDWAESSREQPLYAMGPALEDPKRVAVKSRQFAAVWPTHLTGVLQGSEWVAVRDGKLFQGSRLIRDYTGDSDPKWGGGYQIYRVSKDGHYALVAWSYKDPKDSKTTPRHLQIVRLIDGRIIYSRQADQYASDWF
jgi:hypothetical protein